MNPASYILKIKSQKGLTLIEILIVIGVLGVIIGSIFFTLNPAEQLQKARDAQRKNDLSQIQRALETFYNDHGQYPENTANYRIDTDTGPGVNEVNWGGSFSPYISILPRDPSANRRYVYLGNRDSYRIYASLERGSKDQNACKPDGSKCDNAPPTSSFPCGSSSNEVCNYGASSPNVSP
jgi:prepilin-type N-terminal cleavage/methylation domain-containing protein